jgi:hypothetical protein
MIKRSLIYLLFVISPLHAGTFNVVNTADDGYGSLRNALQSTQTHAGADTIVFSIPESDTGYSPDFCTISLHSPLPELTDDANFIDGFSQPSRSPLEPPILILGKRSIVQPGIVILSAHNIIQGIAVCQFGSTGIQLRGKASHDNIIRGCYSGLSADGKSRLENLGSGLEILEHSHHNSIGNYGERNRNIFSGNGNYGIRVELSHDNIFLNNWAGVDKTGLSAVPNGQVWRQQTAAGLILGLGSYRNTIGDGTVDGRNIFSGNNRTGMRIEWAGTDSNIVRGNFFGVGTDGKTILPNAEAGIVIGRGAAFNIIGGKSPTEANVISGNFSSGIQFARRSRYNILKGNIIGLSADLKSPAPNKHNGIYFYGDDQEGYPRYNTIGPGNIICSNGVENYDEWGWAGLSLNYSGTSHNHFWGNYIGMTPDSSLTAGQPTGILVQGGAHDNLFGPDNRITASLFNGVLVLGSKTLGNTLTRNLIFSNKEKLVENMDGGNSELSPPTILTLESHTIKGTADPGSKVELYRGNSLGTLAFIDSVTVDSMGFFIWQGIVPLDFQILALAIDKEGNTSEFSASDPLPVELLNFQIAILSPNTVGISWITGMEQANYGYYVERSADEKSWQRIGFVAAQSESNGDHYYQVQDTAPSAGIWFYRIVQVDLDGATTIFPPGSVSINDLNDLKLCIYPTPFKTLTRVEIEGKSKNVEICVYNSRGQEVKKLWQGNLAGSMTLQWKGDDAHGNLLASGLYFIVAKSPHHQIKSSTIKLN